MLKPAIATHLTCSVEIKENLELWSMAIFHAEQQYAIAPRNLKQNRQQTAAYQIQWHFVHSDSSTPMLSLCQWVGLSLQVLPPFSDMLCYCFSDFDTDIAEFLFITR